MIRVEKIIPVTVDHSKIDLDHLDRIAGLPADPDGQVFPWLDGYPYTGSVVYWDGGLWQVVDREAGASANDPSAITLIVPAWMPWPDEGPRGVARAELRPVTWTQDHEWILGSAVDRAFEIKGGSK